MKSLSPLILIVAFPMAAFASKAQHSTSMEELSSFVGMYKVENVRCVQGGMDISGDGDANCKANCIQIGYSDTDHTYFIKAISFSVTPMTDEHKLLVTNGVDSFGNTTTTTITKPAPDSFLWNWDVKTSTGEEAQSDSWYLQKNSSDFEFVETSFQAKDYPMPENRYSATYQLQLGQCNYNP